MNFFKLLIVTVLFLGFNIRSVKAQDSLIVYDVVATLSPKINPPIAQGSAPQLSSQLKLNAFFKVNQPQNISEIYIQIGQNPNGTEFKNDTLTITDVNGVLNTYHANQQVSRFWSQSTNYEINLPISDMQNKNWLTVYVKDSTNNFSAKKYFKIQ